MLDGALGGKDEHEVCPGTSVEGLVCGPWCLASESIQHLTSYLRLAQQLS